METDTQTDGMSPAVEEDRTPPSPPGPPKKPASQTLDQGQRLLANIQHAGDTTAMTNRAEGKRIIVGNAAPVEGDRHNVNGFG